MDVNYSHHITYSFFLVLFVGIFLMQYKLSLEDVADLPQTVIKMLIRTIRYYGTDRLLHSPPLLVVVVEDGLTA